MSFLHLPSSFHLLSLHSFQVSLSGCCIALWLLKSLRVPQGPQPFAELRVFDRIHWLYNGLLRCLVTIRFGVILKLITYVMCIAHPHFWMQAYCSTGLCVEGHSVCNKGAVVGACFLCLLSAFELLCPKAYITTCGFEFIQYNNSWSLLTYTVESLQLWARWCYP